MSAGGFEPPSYYKEQRSPSPLLLILIAAAFIFVLGGVLAFAMGLGPFAAAPPGSATPQAPTNQPTNSSRPGSPALTTQATSGQSTSASQLPPTPAGPPPTIPADALGQLLFHVPEDIRATCIPEAVAAPAVVAVNCLSGLEIEVTYTAYGDATGMYAEYNSSVDKAQFDRDSGLCYEVNTDSSVTATMDKWPSEHDYAVGGNPVGRYFCIERGLPTITWTDDRLNILSLATASNGDANRLVGFWLNEAGPIP